MKTRHLNELLGRLERVADLGCAVIRKEELKLWYGVERVGRSVYADIYDKWTSELEHEQPLLIGRSPGEFVLVWGQGLTVDSDAWFKDVGALSKKKALEVDDESDD